MRNVSYLTDSLKGGGLDTLKRRQKFWVIVGARGPAGGVTQSIELWPLTTRAGVQISAVLTNAHALVR